MDKRIEEILVTISESDAVVHGGPGSGRYPKGSSGNTPGSRKAMRDSGGSTSKDKKKKAAEKVDTIVSKKKTVKNMSTKELEAANKRRRAEEEYKKNTPSAKRKEQAAKDQAEKEKSERVAKEKAEREAKDAHDLEVRKVRTAGEVTETTGRLIKNEGSGIAEGVRKYKNAKEIGDYSQMSTSELRAKTDRLIAEKGYIDAAMNKTTASQKKVEAFLTIAGSVVVITGGILGIISKMKDVKDK